MKKSILGTKIGMTRIFDDIGNAIPSTVLKVDKCWIVGKKTIQKDGYNALQVGYQELPDKRVNKPYGGIFKNVLDGKAPRVVKEFKTKAEDIDSYEIGAVLEVDLFKEGDYVDVTSLSRGRGFAGVVKRHGFSGLSSSHGHGEYRRAPGSIGASSAPSRVFKGKKMPGRLGGDKVTVQKLEVVKVLKEESLLLLKGAVPGVKGAVVTVQETGKALKEKKIKEGPKEAILKRKR